MIATTWIAACGATDPVSNSWRNGVAIMGWDMVSFYAGAPKRGSGAYTFEHKGVEWHFATQGNRDLFALNPEAFQPAYGGYDAWALAHGKIARGDPQYHARVNGQIYFNFNARTLALWELDPALWLSRSDANWPQILETG